MVGGFDSLMIDFGDGFFGSLTELGLGGWYDVVSWNGEGEIFLIGLKILYLIFYLR